MNYAYSIEFNKIKASVLKKLFFGQIAWVRRYKN